MNRSNLINCNDDLTIEHKIKYKLFVNFSEFTVQKYNIEENVEGHILLGNIIEKPIHLGRIALNPYSLGTIFCLKDTRIISFDNSLSETHITKIVCARKICLLKLKRSELYLFENNFLRQIFCRKHIS